MPIHRSHPNHELILTLKSSLYRCNGCKMYGHGERYRCNGCDYDLHKECMHQKEALTLEAFPGCTFKILDRNMTSSRCWCDMCAKPIEGFSYHCKEEGVDLHPRCAMLERKMSVNGVVLELYNGVLADCDCCESKELEGALKIYPGFSYVSQCKEYNFHVYCLMQMLIIQDALLAMMYSNLVNNNAGMERREPVPIPDGKLQSTNVRKKKSITVKVAKVCFGVTCSLLTGDPTGLFGYAAVELFSQLIS